MKARQLFERAAAPVEAPPKPAVKPDVKPAEPGRPATPSKHPNPFRRRRAPGEDPGPMPRPKACVEAKALFGRKKVPARPDARKQGIARPLPALMPPVARTESAKMIIRSLR